MKNALFVKIMLAVVVTAKAQELPKETKVVKKNGMTVRWYHTSRHVHFKMEAPTEGWVAIGFHDEPPLTDAYLVMGAVDYGTVIISEFYTHRPGDYQSIKSLDGTDQLGDRGGEETVRGSMFSFSLPLGEGDRHRKSLCAGQTYYLTLAYSREDDFQHHSMMRTALEITL